MWTSLKHRATVNHKLPKIHRVTQLKFTSYDQRAAQSARRAKLTLDILGINHAGPVPLPMKLKRFNWLKNPFKWKKHQELSEIRTYSQLLTFECDMEKTKMVLDFILKYTYGGTGIRVRKFAFEPLEKYYKSPYTYSVDVDLENHLQKLRESKKKKLIVTGRPVPEQIFPATVIHINKKGETTVTPVFEEPPLPSLKSFEEDPSVLDEDIVYDDSDYRFPDPNRSTYEKTELHQILKALHQKVGLNLEIGKEVAEGESQLSEGLVFHGREPVGTTPPPPLDTSALPPDIDDLGGDIYHIPMARNMWEPRKTQWIPGPNEFLDVAREDDEWTADEEVEEDEEEEEEETDKLHQWERQWANPQKQPTPKWKQQRISDSRQSQSLQRPSSQSQSLQKPSSQSQSSSISQSLQKPSLQSLQKPSPQSQSLQRPSSQSPQKPSSQSPQKPSSQSPQKPSQSPQKPSPQSPQKPSSPQKSQDKGKK